MAEKSEFWKQFRRLVFLALFAAVAVVASIVIMPLYAQQKSLERKRADFEARIENVKREIAEIRENRNRFNNDREFVEKLARQNRRVFPGELVFIFDEK